MQNDLGLFLRELLHTHTIDFLSLGWFDCPFLFGDWFIGLIFGNLGQWSLMLRLFNKLVLRYELLIYWSTTFKVNPIFVWF